MRSRVFLSVALIPLVMVLLRGGNGGVDIIVKLRNGHSVRELSENYGTRKAGYLANRGIWLIHVDDSTNGQAVLHKIQKEPAVEDAEIDRRVKLTSARLANVSPELVQDMMALLDGQTMTSFNGTTVLKAYAEQRAMTVIGADQVRKIKDMMSLLDQDMMSLLDHKLIFLLNRSLASILNSAAGSCAFPPAFGHGTLVAGTIHVVAPDARLVPIKAFDAYGYTTMFNLIESVYKAIDLDVDVLNMSFSTMENSDIFRKSLDTAKEEGIAIVASAGNDARDGNGLYPAAYPSVFGIAATDLNDRLASFSNYGTGVSATAPGAYVISTLPGGKYAAVWGTSFSAPVVSGAMALLASNRGHGKSSATLVINTADSIDALNPGYEKKLGKGRINVRQALGIR